MNLKYYGWYDGSPKSQGNVVLSYWNYIVNEYPSVGEDQNDLSRYSKSHYVEACKRYMDEHTKVHPDRKFFIDIPLAEVYYVGTRLADDGFKENIPVWKTLDWIEYVVRELDTDERVLGWYHADEPEVWGYREIVNGNVTNSNPKLEYDFLRNRYWHIKGNSQKPILAVFCDTKLFIDNYYNKILETGPFFDIFGFDYYPFSLTNKSLDPNSQINTKKFRDFINISSNIRNDMPILYVGQGSGSKEFNTRNPTLDEHKTLFKTFIQNCPKERRFGYLLWSYSYADSLSKVNGDIALLPSNIQQWEYEADNKVETVKNTKKIIWNYLKKVLYFFRLRNIK
jgi:hypothetical protein